MKQESTPNEQPVVRTREEFDQNTGWWIERVLFNHRAVVIAVCMLITIVLGYGVSKVRLNASFEKTIPTRHPYIANYLKHKSDLGGLGNAIRITVEAKNGTIYTPEYLDTLRKISEEIFLTPGIDRAYMKSLWTPSAQWRGVTEEGFEAGPVVPNDYDGSAASVALVQRNVERSGEIGQIVAANYKSSIVYAPLLPRDTETGKPLDYGALSDRLEAIRNRYQSAVIAIHITGFAKVLGDLIGGLRWFLLFFASALIIDTIFLLYYIRCWRSTAVVVCCSLIAVFWLLGILNFLGYELDPYSILVPFLIFSIGTSHGSQKMNGILQDVGRGTHQLVAARYTFRRLFLAGLTALLADAVGFAVLSVIHIQVIQELALTASIGVAILIVTNLMLVPILLSYTGVDPKAAERSLRTELAEQTGGAKNPIWRFLDAFTQRKWAAVAICVGVALAIVGLIGKRDLKIGDLSPGAPELRENSQYNRDNAYLTANYGATSDVLAVMVETPTNECSRYHTLTRVDSLDSILRDMDGVETTTSLAIMNRQLNVGYNEGNLKWYDLPRNQDMLNTLTSNSPRGLYNDNCSLIAVSAFLKDHKADTLTRVTDSVESFAAKNNTEDVKFLLAAGTAGIDAATNIVVKKASQEMLFLVYGAVIVLCFITFRSWRAVIIAVLPLMLTSILCEALMAKLGMGVKVATLPVTALGVGIGVDYALYMLSVTLSHLRAGKNLSEAYYATLCFTGRVVLFTGITLAVGVITWAFSPIKFQADVGILLAFMFVWNMLGALILLPALACFLLPKNPERIAVANGLLKEGEIDPVSQLHVTRQTS
jgi:predicted RND superfamily exporter protein